MNTTEALGRALEQVAGSLVYRQAEKASPHMSIYAQVRGALAQWKADAGPVRILTVPGENREVSAWDNAGTLWSVTTYSSGRTELHLGPRATLAWAMSPGRAWPCSVLSGYEVTAEFASNGDLVEITLIDAPLDVEPPADEFAAMSSDFLRLIDPSHPAIRSR